MSWYGPPTGPTAQVQLHEMAARCLAEPEVFVSIVSSLLFDKSFWATDPTTGPLGARLQQNIPSGPIPAPLFLGQGETDPLVLPSAQKQYVQQRCASGGGPVLYKTYAGRDHVGVVQPDSPLIPDLIQWTQDRLAGKPAPSNCSQLP